MDILYDMIFHQAEPSSIHTVERSSSRNNNEKSGDGDDSLHNLLKHHDHEINEHAIRNKTYNTADDEQENDDEWEAECHLAALSLSSSSSSSSSTTTTTSTSISTQDQQQRLTTTTTSTHCTTAPILVWDEAVHLCYIPHFSDYQEEERTQLWYTPAEMQTMKLAYFLTRESTNPDPTHHHHHQHQQQHQNQDDMFSSMNEETCDCMNDSERSSSSSSSSSTPTSVTVAEYDHDSSLRHHRSYNNNTARDRYLTSMLALLEEQSQQRWMCQQVYGRIEIYQGYSGIFDPDRLAYIYSTHGNTQYCQRIAEERGRLLQQEVAPHRQKVGVPRTTDADDKFDEELLLFSSSIRSRSSATTTTTTTATTTATTDGNNENVKPSSTRSSSRLSSPLHLSSLSLSNIASGTCLSTLSTSFESCIDSFFHALLKPILELRQGDIFLTRE